jgi:hypothetical protein
VIRQSDDKQAVEAGLLHVSIEILFHRSPRVFDVSRTLASPSFPLSAVRVGDPGGPWWRGKDSRIEAGGGAAPFNPKKNNPPPAGRNLEEESIMAGEREGWGAEP